MVVISTFAVTTVFLVHTMRSNWDFVDFYQGKQREAALPYAHQNLYLAEQAQWIDMSSMLYSSIEYGLKDNVKQYVMWGEKRLKEKPNIDLYIKLAVAYRFLAEKEAYCDVVTRGLQIYPRSEELKPAITVCGN